MYTTRYGRTVKQPERYEPPEEELIDDYKEDEYDSDEDYESVVDSEEDEEEEEDYSDVDENGNLAGFVESDGEEDDD